MSDSVQSNLRTEVSAAGAERIADATAKRDAAKNLLMDLRRQFEAENPRPAGADDVMLRYYRRENAVREARIAASSADVLLAQTKLDVVQSELGPEETRAAEIDLRLAELASENERAVTESHVLLGGEPPLAKEDADELNSDLNQMFVERAVTCAELGVERARLDSREPVIAAAEAHLRSAQLDLERLDAETEFMAYMKQATDGGFNDPVFEQLEIDNAEASIRSVQAKIAALDADMDALSCFSPEKRQQVVEYDKRQRPGLVAQLAALARELMLARKSLELTPAADQLAPTAPDKSGVKEVTFTHSKYEGGHPALGEKGNFSAGNLHVGTAVLGVWTFKPGKTIRMVDVASIEVTGGEIRKSKAGAVMAFGVLGLAAKGAKNQTALIVRTHDGNAAYFTIDKINAMKVRARLAPVLRAAAVPFSDDLPEQQVTDGTAGAPQPDLADQLRKLAALRDDGLLTQEEFAAQKARLLSE